MLQVTTKYRYGKYKLKKDSEIWMNPYDQDKTNHQQQKEKYKKFDVEHFVNDNISKAATKIR